jgi:hypothetical protein
MSDTPPTVDVPFLPDSPTRSGGDQETAKDRRINELEEKLNLVISLLAKKETSKESKEEEEEPNTMADIIGYNDFRADNRNEAQMQMAVASSVSAKNRAALSVSEKSKFLREASRGIAPDKFKPLIDLNGLDSLLTMDNIVGFNTLKDDLENYLSQHGLANVFYILKFDILGHPIDPSTSGGETINYLSNPQLTTLAEVEKTSEYLLLKGSIYHVENLRWSFEAIMNSCNQDLRVILKAKMERYNKVGRTGPILYAHLLAQLTSSSPQAVRKVTQNIVDLKMDKFEGESIPMACKSVRACYKWLDMVNKMPVDPETIILNIFESCTVPEFLRYIESLKTHSELTPGLDLTVDYLLSRAEEKYRDLVLTSKWDISGTGASFNLSRNHGSPNSGNSQRNPDRPSLFSKPKEGESEVKTILGQEYKYCGKCHRWNKGARAHTTSEHVVGLRRDTDTSSTGAEATSTGTETGQPTTPNTTTDSRTRHPSAQSYHFKRVTVSFLGGI